MNSIKIRNSLDVCEIEIEGTIGVPEQWQFSSGSESVATYEGFREALQHIEQVEASRVVVNIRSTGGDVNDALLIYDALTSLDAAITTRCYGYVASAATVIAQAASDGERQISPNSLYLIHNSSCTGEGNAEELEAKATLLRKTDERLAELYARRSGQEASIFTELMAEDSGRGRWLSAEEVVEMGLADTIIESVAAVEQPAEQETEETEEAPAVEEAGVVQNIVQSIARRLGRRIKGAFAERGSAAEAAALMSEAPQDRINVLHEQITSRSQIAFEQGQAIATQTATCAAEDPIFSNTQLRGNSQAYDEDARRIRTRKNL